MSKATKANAVETMMSRIVARASKDSGDNLRRLGDTPLHAVEVVSTGSLNLDLAMGVGGFPRGRIGEVYGAEAVGKTTLILRHIVEMQKQGLGVAFIDAEHALDVKYAQSLGVNTDDLYVAQPMCGEEALELVCNLAESAAAEIVALEAAADAFAKANKCPRKPIDRTGILGLIVVDSVAALVPKVELEGEIVDQQMGVQARMMGKAMRKLTAAANISNVEVIFINQTREKIGGYGGKTTSGGNALKFFASFRISLTNIGQIKDGETKIGNRVKATVVKNKVAAPFVEVEYDVIAGEGIDHAGEVIDTAREHGIMSARGAWLAYNDKNIANGRPATKAALRANPDLMAEIEGKVRESVATYGMKGPPKTKGKKPVEDPEGEDGVAA